MPQGQNIGTWGNQPEHTGIAKASQAVESSFSEKDIELLSETSSVIALNGYFGLYILIAVGAVLLFTTVVIMIYLKRKRK